MSVPRFFSASPLPRPFKPHVMLEVSEAVARHLQVLRIATGDALTLFDGEGGEYAATLVHIGKRDATVTLTAFDPIEREAPIRITLVQALAASDKMDLIVQKAVELGVTEIAPIASVRATVKLDAERAVKRVLHWRAIAVAACEQCGRNRVPVVHGLQTFNQWSQDHQGLSMLLDPRAEKPLLAIVDATKPITLLVGPEGGFSDEEIAHAAAHGVIPAKFGPRLLRTETAGLAAIAALAARFGDLGTGM